MSNLIELEASYHVENFEEILRKIKEKNYKFGYKVQKQDTYYTDKKLEFIKTKTCLRTRKTNNEKLELTFKPKTTDSTEKYGKKEVNIALDVKDLEDIKFILNGLGYDEYISFTKNRTVYTKNECGFEHNIMLDSIENVGNFIELEIIAHTEEEKEKLHDELDRFTSNFECEKLKEKTKPYRDLVKDAQKINNNNV